MSYEIDPISQFSIDDRVQKAQEKLNRSDKQQNNNKLKQIQTSVLDLLQRHESKDTYKNKNITEQQQQRPRQSIPSRPSIIKTADVAKVLSKKSVTFASVFDLHQTETDKDDDATSLVETNSDNNEPIVGQDLITVVPNKPYNDEKTIETNANIEPYPFRSEISLSVSPQSNSPNNLSTHDDHVRKKLMPNIFHSHRPKKLRHPIHTYDPVSKKQRSSSAPDLMFPLSLSTPSKSIMKRTSTTTITTAPITTMIPRNSINMERRPSKTNRTWLKIPLINRVVQSLNKNSTQPQQQQQNSKTNFFSKKKNRTGRHSTELKQVSDYIY